jgi:hypothetical protein
MRDRGGRHQDGPEQMAVKMARPDAGGRTRRYEVAGWERGSAPLLQAQWVQQPMRIFPDASFMTGPIVKAAPPGVKKKATIHGDGCPWINFY